MGYAHSPFCNAWCGAPCICRVFHGSNNANREVRHCPFCEAWQLDNPPLWPQGELDDLCREHLLSCLADKVRLRVNPGKPDQVHAYMETTADIPRGGSYRLRQVSFPVGEKPTLVDVVHEFLRSEQLVGGPFLAQQSEEAGHE